MNIYKNNTINRRLRTFLIPLLACWSFAANAQSIEVSLDTVVNDPGDSVTVSLYVKNFSQVGSATFYIQFPSSSIRWGRVFNWNPQLLNGVHLANASGGVLGIIWFDMNGVNIPDGKFADLRFKYLQGLGTLHFTTSCEITDTVGVPLIPNPVYYDGLVMPPLSLAPTSNPSVLCTGNSAVLSANAAGLFGLYHYSWASSPPGFISSFASPTVTPVIPTRYFVTVSYGAYSDTASVFLDVATVPPPAPVTNMLPADGSINLETPIMLSWSPGINTNTFDLYWWPVSSTRPPTPNVPHLQQVNYSLNASLLPGTSYRWQVISVNQCHDKAGPLAQFTTKALPELHVSQLTISNAIAGQTMEVSWTVKNDGLGSTNALTWYDRIWLTPDVEVRVGESEDVLLAYYSNPIGLGPGQYYTQTRQIELPADLVGTYYVFVISDALDALFIDWQGAPPPVPYVPPPYLSAWTHYGAMVNVVKEVSDDNGRHDNFFYKQINFLLPPLPDLQVTQISKSFNVFSGQPMNVSWMVKNMGQASALASTWTDRIYLSQDSILDTENAFVLASVVHQGQLFPDSLYLDTVSVEIPDYIFGWYNVFIQTDIFDQVNEHAYNANNIARSDSLQVFLTPPPDLIVSSIKIPNSASNNQMVEIKYTVENQGITSTSSPWGWMDYIYICNLLTFDSSEAVLLKSIHRTDNLSPSESYTRTVSTLIPHHLTGQQFIFIKTDAQNVVYEYQDDSNNVARSEDPIQINNADLVIGRINLPISNSDNAAVACSWYDKNVGPGSIISRPWLDKLYLLSSAVFDTNYIVSVDSLLTVSSMASGDSLSCHKDIVLPNLPDGNYFLFVETDSRMKITEGNEGNNFSRSENSISLIHPDLIVNQIISPDTLESGYAVQITHVLTNKGPGTIINKAVREKIFLSSDTVFNRLNDTLIGQLKVDVDLIPGESDTILVDCIIPFMGPSNYYLFAEADCDDDVPEGNYENNNTSHRKAPIVLISGPSPDLVILQFQIGDTLEAGYPAEISYTIKNLGDKLAESIPWTDKLYRFYMPVWDSSIAVVMKSTSHNTLLKPDSSYVFSGTVDIPASLAGGLYYFYLVTDADHGLYEHNAEFNNVFGPVIIHINPVNIDLSVTQASSQEDSIMSGSALGFSYVVTNTGEFPTNAVSWTDALYLSADTVYNSENDILAGDWVKNGPLSKGSSYSISKQQMLPNGLSGEYYPIVVTDLGLQNADLDPSNNSKILLGNDQKYVKLNIQLSPSPDLVIQDLVVPTLVYSGLPFYVKWKVRNNGMGYAVNSWSDKFYLSQDFLINMGDILLGAPAHNDSLAPGEEYIDSAEIVCQSSSTANFAFLAKTDAGNQVYEHNGEDNNVSGSMMLVVLPDPGDLVIGMISIDTSAIAGGELPISYQLANLGDHLISGQIKDAIYLSSDTLFSNDDLLLATYTGNHQLGPFETDNVSLNCPIPGVTEGSYSFLIKTDILNNISETNESNNTRNASEKTAIHVPSLFMDVPYADRLPNMHKSYYKINIPDSLAGMSLLLILKADSVNGNNQVFSMYEQIPGLLEYENRTPVNFSGNQELVIPEIKGGTYYIFLTGYTNTGDFQDITITSHLLDFSIRYLEANQGGNLGSVTVKVNGSMFTPGMKLSLKNDSTEISASNLIFADASLVIATFSLYSSGFGESNYEFIEVPYGFYDVVARRPDGRSAVLENGFEVTAPLEPELLAHIQYPASVRANRYFTMNIQFANPGNVDIQAPERILLSKYGAPIGFASEDLVYNLRDLKLEFREPGCPENVLRPGAMSEIQIHCKSSSRLVFKLIK